MTFNDTSSTLQLLLTRRSGKARDLGNPGPSDAQWRDILQAAIRVPDHGKLNPWRLVDIPAAARAHFADVIERAFRTEKPEAGPMEVEGVRAYALQGPRLVAVISRTDPAHKIPVWEQELSAGALCQNLLLAAHALGFLGNWLSGWPAYNASVLAALGGVQGDKIAGFIYVGSCAKILDERPRPDFDAVVRNYADKV
jgi:nitroreductase